MEPVPDLDVETDPLEVRVITPDGEGDSDVLNEAVKLADVDPEGTGE